MPSNQTTYLARYTAGEHQQVWTELQALGEAVREEPHFSDALSVARETMRRARHNLELLIPRLHHIGYDFSTAWVDANHRLDRAWALQGIKETPEGDLKDELTRSYSRRWPDEDSMTAEKDMPAAVLDPPPCDVSAEREELERLVGTVPLSVRAWYEMVGGVNLVGVAPQHWWPDHIRELEQDVPDGIDPRDWVLANRAGITGRLDPLCLWSVGDALDYERVFSPSSAPGEQLNDSPAADESDWVLVEPIDDPDGIPNAVVMGPDENGKYHISGSGGAGVQTPSPTMDGLYFNETYRAPFIDYLRQCFRWGGFPGLRDPATRTDAIERDVSYLTDGFLPL